MRYYLFIMIFMIFVSIYFSGVSNAYKVTMTFEFNVSGKNNTIRANDTNYNGSAINGVMNFTPPKKFISAQENKTVTSVFGLIFAGSEFFDIILENKTDTTYKFSLSQNDRNNRLLIAFTNGTYETIENSLDIVNEFFMISKTFAGYTQSIPKSFDLFMRLEYRNLLFTNRSFWPVGPQTIRIKNNGRGSNSVNRINITVVI